MSCMNIFDEKLKKGGKQNIKNKFKPVIVKIRYI